ncbi:glycoside hydrolase family 3 N-terminal domain-containing protein [Daejeonella sp. JGW-45]|uniref:glycoside hydrolase family 3 protein n=1 Tax=Daejeonella sp. JGW-45 TaxID=3034148 RepID=UPI0023ED73A6|nr:glycoside hydrolase family 3 N-terminal domain-containing protein [Daejeonella sp. JGW-45]
MYCKLKSCLLAIFLILPFIGLAQTPKSFVESLNDSNAWVDSVFDKLNRRERIAQLFMVRAHTDKGKAYEDSVGRVIKKEGIGGLVFFQGGPGRQAILTNEYQSRSKVPLLIAMDAEWGLGMRLDSTVSFPYQMTLGAIQDNNLIYEMGRQVALDFQRLGMHVNFAPDADINNNPKNPVIGYRSFGDNKFNVATKAGAYMKGLQDNKVMVSIKHFPGHGDTDVDSHYDLPQLPFSRARLDSLEIYPFKELIKQGASGVMVAHMNIPALDNTKNLPSTLSKPIVTGILKEDLGFKGLIFSDAMEMKGVVKFFPHGEADVRAIIAGNDVIELSENTARAVRLVRKAIRTKRLSWEQVNESVRKVLTAKYWVGLDNVQPLKTTDVAAELNRAEALVLNQRLADAAVTVLNSDSQIRSLDKNKRTALVSMGPATLTTFQNMLKPDLGNSMNFLLSKNASAEDIANVTRELRDYDQIIVAIHDLRKRPAAALDFNDGMKLFIAELAKMNSTMVLFANPYTIAGLPGIERAKTILVNYQNSEEAQRASAKVIAGKLKASGKLPVSVSTNFKNGDGITQ